MKLHLLTIIAVFAFAKAYSQGEGATYNITFDSNWSQAAHPHSSGSLPGGAHWSRLVGAVHNDQVTFLEMGALATQGIENIAEAGSNGVFNDEVTTAITAGNASQWLDLGDLDSALGQITGTDIEVSFDYPLITLVSMIAPSPDWIIAINNVSLLDDTDNWIEEIVIDLYPYDAGTDNGLDYTSGNADTNPAQPIASLQGTVPFSSEKIGTMTLSLGAVLSTENPALSSDITLYPNPTTGLINIATPSPEGTVRLYDINGRLLSTNSLTATEIQLDFRNLTAGIYMVMIENDVYQTTKKLIKR